MVALDLTSRALGFVVADTIGAAKARRTHLAASATVIAVGLQVLAAAAAHGLTGQADACAVVAVLAGLAALAALPTVGLVCCEVLQVAVVAASCKQGVNGA